MEVPSTNHGANLIAQSASFGYRIHSYIERGSPSWLMESFNNDISTSIFFGKNSFLPPLFEAIFGSSLLYISYVLYFVLLFIKLPVDKKKSVVKFIVCFFNNLFSNRMNRTFTKTIMTVAAY